MQSCNTIYREACYNSHISHSYLTIVYNCHLCDLVLITRISLLDLIYKTAVDLFYDLIDTWKQTGE